MQMRTKIDRNRQTPGTTIHKETSCGTLYITINRQEGMVIEVFIDLGKAGGCSKCQNEALARVISMGLQHGVPAIKYMETLRGLQCPTPIMFPKEARVLSCADAIAQALQEEMAYAEQNS
jgi:ribonucleoside-diphosphate reductase alpha chain